MRLTALFKYFISFFFVLFINLITFFFLQCDQVISSSCSCLELLLSWNAELSDMDKFIRYLAMIINLAGFLCCMVLLTTTLYEPKDCQNFEQYGICSCCSGVHTNDGYLPLTLSTLIVRLAFLALLAIFLVDIS